MAGESVLATRLMILKQPPVEAIPFKRGVAQRDFVVLIVGFGPLGQQALRRLVMNGQFVGSRMRAVVVDADAQDRADAFCREYPAMEGCCTLEYHTSRPKAPVFSLCWRRLPPICAMS